MNRRVVIVPLALVMACASAPANDAARTDALNASKRRAAVQLEAQEYAAAAQTLEGLAAQTPRDDQVFVMLGDARRGLGEFDPAVRAYEQAIRINYGDYLPHLKLGTWLMENGKTGRALTEFEVAVKFDGADPLTHYNYGLALYELGRREEALAQWRAAREIDPGNPGFAEAVGIGLTGVDDAAAVEAFDEAERLGQDGAAFHNNRAQALERAGRYDDAARWYRAAAEAADTREGYQRNHALFCLRQARYDEAARQLEGLVAAYGERWSYCVYLARARVALGEFAGALAALEPFRAEVEAGALDRTSARVDAVPPTLAEALAQAGMAWRGQKDLVRARQYLARAVALDAQEPSHLINYGVVLAESGMLPEARAQWKRVLELDPGNATARANLSAYER